jgi:hypothetical protein
MHYIYVCFALSFVHSTYALIHTYVSFICIYIFSISNAIYNFPASLKILWQKKPPKDNSGIDVIILKIFLQKNLAKKLAFFIILGVGFTEVTFDWVFAR